MTQKQVKIEIPENGQFDQEELKAERIRIIEEKKKIINDLNKIKVPLQAQVFSHHGTWTIRNVTFWEMFQKRDEDIMEFMEKYLVENK